MTIKKDVIIVVSGGVVQSVYSNESNLDIAILDYDNTDHGEHIHLEQRIKTLKEIY